MKSVGARLVNKSDIAKMTNSICPTCNMPMWKNNNKTHSKAKAAVCEAKFREKVSVFPNEQFVTIEGKRYLIDANYRKNI